MQNTKVFNTIVKSTTRLAYFNKEASFFLRLTGNIIDAMVQ